MLDEHKVGKDYKEGFTTNVEAYTLPPGLNEDVIRKISSFKKEPEWLLEWRLRAYKNWLKMKQPEWSKLKIQPIYKKNTSRIRDDESAYNFTSARIDTKNLKSFSHPAKISICFKVPKGIGFWPAFWLMPVEEIQWPNGGEIDIMENRGRISNIASSALHFGEKWNISLRIVKKER